jgi:hypothetical protein
MNEEEFWALVEGTISGRGCNEMAYEVEEQLKVLGPTAAMGFTNRFHEVMDRLYTWDLWGVAYILRGGCSDDSFEYFRAWVVSLGREATERALADPEGFGLGIDLGPGHEFDVDMDCEALLHAGPSAVNALSGEYPSRANAHPKVPAGSPGKRATPACGHASRYSWPNARHAD